jgi:hypothetical protein
MLDPATGCRAGRATLLRATHKPLLSLSWPLATPGPHRPDESHTTSVGSRKASDEPSAWTKPRQDRSYRQFNKQPMSEHRFAGLAFEAWTNTPSGYADR